MVQATATRRQRGKEGLGVRGLASQSCEAGGQLGSEAKIYNGFWLASLGFSRGGMASTKLWKCHWDTVGQADQNKAARFCLEFRACLVLHVV